MCNSQRCDHTTPLFHKACILQFNDWYHLECNYLCIKLIKMNCRRTFKGYLLSMITSTTHKDKISFYEHMHQLIEGICH